MTDELPNYRGWKVYRGRWPEPQWLAVHPDYDASYEGPEDGWVDNGLKAHGDTYEDLCDLIDDLQDEWNEVNSQFGVGA